MNLSKTIAQELKVRPSQVTAVISLLDSGNTIPFIARYRKEMTGSLDEEQLRQVNARLGQLRSLDERRQTILKAIGGQGKLTPDLDNAIRQAESMTALEYLYQPYKQKRRTRATIARENGLEPLAKLIIAQIRTEETAVQIAAPFITETTPTPEDAFFGARDIVAEIISDHAQIRQRVREKALQYSSLISQKIKKAEDDRTVYRLYYDFKYRVDRLKPHQTLAINRGEAEKILRVKLEIAERDWLIPVRQFFRPDRRSPLASQLQAAMTDAAHRLLLPAIERDVRRHLTEKAEARAIQVFAQNMRGLLNQPPLTEHTILAIDPGFRTGSKVALIDATGKALDTATIYPHLPQRRWDEALKTLAMLIQRHGVTLIAIGNGTASRETERLAAELTRKLDNVHYLIVNEAGASVYSASKLAGAELPELDVTLRGAVSIGRRVQDPLAELVKIDPKSIGVGLYQHDVNQKALGEALTAVVESVVNQVGVDVNTASPALLTHISGIGPRLAERMVKYREEHGRFRNRQAIKNVNGLGSKAFEQAAGFLRIRDGDEPLDASAIHPESYGVATAVLERAHLQPTSPPAERELALKQLLAETTIEKLAAELNTGAPTLTDILEQLVRPGRDPRDDLPPPILRNDVLSMADLKPGMRLKGTVRNVVDFGA
ncbi:MAG: Tex family protein, partial [Anaerolineae bacterium]